MGNRFPVADAHCDFLYSAVHGGFELGTLSNKQSLYLPFMMQGNVKLQFFAVWIDMLLKKSPLNQCLSMIDAYYRMLDKYPELTQYDGIPDPSSPRIATVLTVEGGEAIEGSLENLNILYRLGVRAMTLTWNNVNSLAYPATKRSKNGLSDKGKSVVKRMCELGMAVDVAHLNDSGIDDVLSIATAPIISSHTNAYSICPHPRCIKDEHILRIAQGGGVIGVNFYHKQLSQAKQAGVSDVLRHIEHIISIGGVGCVALGSDFDGMDECIPGLEDSRGFEMIANSLVNMGINDADITAIMYGNLANYFARFCKARHI